MNEEVKKILNDYEYDNRRVKKHYKLEKTPDWLEGVYAQRICLLFEPERDYEERVEIDEGGNIVKVEPEPDEGGLLTDEECRLVELRMGESLNWCQPILKAQRDLTASIKDAECQDRVERIFKEGDESCDGDDTHWGTIYIPPKEKRECPECWQALKEKEEK